MRRDGRHGRGSSPSRLVVCVHYLSFLGVGVQTRPTRFYENTIMNKILETSCKIQYDLYGYIFGFHISREWKVTNKRIYLGLISRSAVAAWFGKLPHYAIFCFGRCATTESNSAIDIFSNCIIGVRLYFFQFRQLFSNLSKIIVQLHKTACKIQPKCAFWTVSNWKKLYHRFTKANTGFYTMLVRGLL